MIPVRIFSLYTICDVHGNCEHSIIFKEINFIDKKVYYYQFCNLCEEDSIRRGKKYFSNEYSTSIENWDLYTPPEYEPKPN